MTRWPILRLVGLALAVVAVPAVGAGPKAPGKSPEKVEIRPKYKKGRMLRYKLALSGAVAWNPKAPGLEWRKMVTDFSFTLRAKAVRDSGACTFDLLGENLKSAADGPDGKIEVTATPKKCKLKVNGKWKVFYDKGPLTKEMTITFGPLGGFRFGTGLLRIAGYMLPHVDRRFWTLLTVAPLDEVGPGDTWTEQFELPVPGAKGKPMNLQGKWKVIGWQRYRGRKVLAIALAAKLDLKNSKLLLKNGDLVRVVTGSYEAAGRVLWDVEHGFLCSAVAEQEILIKADKPTRRAMRSKHRCSLQLIQAK